jgi:preprotein translocase SecE subunit
VARNRKRAKERRNRRPPSVDGQVAVARGSRDEHATAPSPLEHATPDKELAEAQLALGRPELTGEQSPAEIEALTEAEEQEEEREDYANALPGGIPGVFPGQPQIASAPNELEQEYEFEPDARSGRGGDRRGGGGAVAVSEAGAGGSGGVAPVRAFPGSRLINFLQGSWRELQRVQWPDRRQVVQATGVVIGFVIFAGLFLGGADWVAGKIVTYILK